MIRFQGISSSSEEFELVWQVVEPLIAKALKRGNSLIPTYAIYNALKTKDMQLWVLKDGNDIKTAVITSIRVMPECLVLEIIALSGKNFLKYKEFVETILTEFAKQHGCNYMEIIGRKGWQKVLKNFNVVSYVLRKEVI